MLTEGNYLLLDEAPWKGLAPLFDLTVMIETGRDTLEERLVRRWLDHGYEPEAAREKTAGNDLVTADIVVSRSRPADLVWRS